MSMRQIRIGDRIVGEGCEPFVIAEVGINHNGELENAYKMIRVAKESGADAVKFQTFKADEFIDDPELTFTYKSQGKDVTESMLKMFRRYEFPNDKWPLIKARCEEEGLIFLSTPQNRSDLDILLKIGIPAIKVGSDDFTNIPLLKSYAAAGLPMIISCGMADLEEVRQAIAAIGALDGHPAVLMLCTSEYPTPPESANLLKLRTLSEAFPNVVMGYSDHTQGSLASALAVALGASIFEKHFTLSHELPGPDHWFSEDPEGLKEWVSAIRKASVMMGSGVVVPTAAESNIRKLARRSIVAISDIRKGEAFSTGNIGLRRPGTGLPPSLYESILGLQAKRDINRRDLIRKEDFA